MPAEPTPERAWTDDEVKRGIELFQKGTSIRKFAAELGVSRHQAERFLSECRAANAPPPPLTPAFRSGRLFPDDDEPQALQPYQPAHNASTPAQDFETLDRTRQELKAKLDRSAQLGDRQGVATYSLALARLNATNDPGAKDGESNYDLSSVPDAVLWFLGIALPALHERLPDNDGEPKQVALTAQQQAQWEFLQRACVALHERAQQPMRSGSVVAIKFEVP